MNWTKFKSGDEEACNEAAKELLPFARIVVRGMSPSLTEEERETAAGDAVLDLIAGMDTIRSEADLRPRLFDCAKCQAVDQWRKTERKKNILKNADSLDAGSNEDSGEANNETVNEGIPDKKTESPDEASQNAERRQAAVEVLSKVEAEDALLLRQYYVLEWSQREIAEKNGWETNSVGNRIKQALNRTRKMLSLIPRLKEICSSDYDQI